MTTIDSVTIERALSRSGELCSSGSIPERFSDITDDSRRVTNGALFVAMRGAAYDGHDYQTCGKARPGGNCVGGMIADERIGGS